MLRTALAAALAVALPAFADDEEPTPVASFAAEASVVSVRALGDAHDDVAWKEITVRVSQCIAGEWQRHQLVTVQVPASQWRSNYGDTVGIVRYEWKDRHGSPRAWVMPYRLDEADQNDRFLRDSDDAVVNARRSGRASTVAAR